MAACCSCCVEERRSQCAPSVLALAWSVLLALVHTASCCAMWVIRDRLLAAVLLHRMARPLGCALFAFLCVTVLSVCTHPLVFSSQHHSVHTKWCGEKTLGGLERAAQRGVEGNMSG